MALHLGLACGGWVPRGRRTEDGRLPSRYPLRETASAGYPQRTRLIVCDSDATPILTRGKPSGGTAFTISCAERLGRPCMLIDLAAGDLDHACARIRRWLAENEVRVLNVAGPRESSAPGVADQAAVLLRAALQEKEVGS